MEWKLFILCQDSVLFLLQVPPPPDGQAISASLRHPAFLAKAVRWFEFAAARRDSCNEAAASHLAEVKGYRCQ